MGQILRYHRGTLTVPARVLDDIDWVLDMDTAAARRDVLAAVATLGDDGRDVTYCGPDVHDYLRPREVDAVQRLRGWNRLRHGSITVDAGLLCDVRNLLDTETFQRDSCDAFLSELDDEIGMLDESTQGAYAASLRAERDALAVFLAEPTGICGRCPWCQALALRDVLDELLNAAGFAPPPYCNPADLPMPASVFWRTRVACRSSELPAA